MKKTGNNERIESGFILILFMVLLPVILVLLGLVVDSANLYSANLKASAAAEAGVTSATIARVKESDTRILNNLNAKDDINSKGGTTSGGTIYEKDYLQKRAIAEATNNLLNNGVKRASGNNSDRGLEINKRGSVDDIEATFNPGNDTLTATVKLRVPTLFMHYLKRDLIDKRSSQIVTGTASVNVQGANYIFVLDLSNSQACPAGTAPPPPWIVPALPRRYCRCNSSNKVKMLKPDGTDKRDADGKLVYESCQEEADRVTDPELRGKLRVEKTRDSLKNALYRLDPKRDRLSIIAFNTVAFTILPFNNRDRLTRRAEQGFDMDGVRSILDQLKSPKEAKVEFARNGNSIHRERYEYRKNGNIINSVQAVPFIVPEGMTNLSDGFLTAYQEARAAGLTNPRTGAPYNVIYYSDGGSTAMRANFPNASTPRYNARDRRRDRAPRRFDMLEENQTNSPGEINAYSSLTETDAWDNDLLNFHLVLTYKEDDPAQPLFGVNQRFDAASPFLSSGSYKRWYLRNLMNINQASQLGASLPIRIKKPRTQYDLFYPPPRGETPSQKVARWATIDAEMNDKRKFYSAYLMSDCFCLPELVLGTGPGTGKAPVYERNCLISATKVDPNITDTDVSKRAQVFSRCLGGSGEFLGRYSDVGVTSDPKNNPSGSKDQFGGGFRSTEIFPPRGVNSKPKDFRYLYYMSAMEAADMIRNKRGKIHGIGYGESTSNLNGMAQGLGDVAGMKEGVMANLTSSFDDLLRIYQTDPNIKITLDEIDNKFKTNNLGYQTLKERKDSGSSGGYFSKAPSALEFEKLLDALLEKIKMSVQTVS